jgi:hypothetical protein
MTGPNSHVTRPHLAWAWVWSSILPFCASMFAGLLFGLPPVAMVLLVIVCVGLQAAAVTRLRISWDDVAVTCRTAWSTQRIELDRIVAVGIASVYLIRTVRVRYRDDSGRVRETGLRGSDWGQLTPRQQKDLVRRLRAAVAASRATEPC